MKKLIATILFINLCITSAYADDGWDCFPNHHACAGVSVKSIYLDFNTKRIYFGDVGFTHYFSMGGASTWTDDAKAAYSLLLAAKATGNKVNTHSQIDVNGIRNVSQIILLTE